MSFFLSFLKILYEFWIYIFNSSFQELTNQHPKQAIPVTTHTMSDSSSSPPHSSGRDSACPTNNLFSNSSSSSNGAARSHKYPWIQSTSGAADVWNYVYKLDKGYRGGEDFLTRHKSKANCKCFFATKGTTCGELLKSTFRYGTTNRKKDMTKKTMLTTVPLQHFFDAHKDSDIAKRKAKAMQQKNAKTANAMNAAAVTSQKGGFLQAPSDVSLPVYYKISNILQKSYTLSIITTRSIYYQYV